MVAVSRRSDSNKNNKKIVLKNGEKCKGSKSTNKVRMNLKGKGKAVKLVVIRKSRRKCLKTKKYSLDTMKDALMELKSGTPYRTVSEKYSIPVSTLHRKLKNPEKTNVSHGPAPILSESVEKDIVSWIIQKAAIGQPVTKTILLDNVQIFLNDLKITTIFKNNRPSRHWYEAFRRRHPEIAIRSAQYLTRARAEATEEVLREWFKEIKEYLQEKNLFTIDGSRIFNCDETNIQLCPKPHKVLTITGASNVYKHTDASEKESLTALMMYSAAGERAPPMILYKYAQKVPKKIAEECPSDWGIGVTETGWMTTEAFYEYFTNVFFPWLIHKKIEFPIVVYLDGHSSHVTMPLVKFCREKKIEIICLYPNSTHITQPLDVSFFHPFKECWRRMIADWKAKNNEARVTKELFPKLLKMTLDSFEGEKISVQNGFRKAGLYPFNPDNVDYKHLEVKNGSRRKSVEDVVSKLQEPKENKYLHLITFEANLDPQILEQFKGSEESKTWNGSTYLQGLFQYWLRIKNPSDGERIKSKPIIKSVEILTGQKIIALSNVQRESINLTGNESIQEPIDETFTDENDMPWLNANIDVNVDPSVTTEHNTVSNNIEDQYAYYQDVPLLLDITNLPLQYVTDNSCTIVAGNDISCHSGTKSISSLLTAVENISNNETHNKENDQSSQLIAVESINNDDTTNNEKDQTTINTDVSSNSLSQSFSSAFTLPKEYLPKKKRDKLQNKPKQSSVGTSDAWLKLNLQKEKEQNKKIQKAEQKKKLMDQKKLLADEKKKLDERMKEIQSQINDVTPRKIKKEKK